MGIFSRFVWLDSQMAEAAKTAYGPHQPGFDEFLFARAAARDIKSLGDSGEGLCSAVLVARWVVELLIRAELARSGSPADASTPGNECWSRWLEQPKASKVRDRFAAEQLALTAAVLAPDGAVMLAKQPLPTLRLILSTLLDWKDLLPEPLDADATGVKRIVKQRWLRLSLISLVIAFGVHAIWHKITDRPNLALYKPVSVSSADVQVGADPKGLTDGNRTMLGFHTVYAPNQTATIDLGRSQKISRIVVFNRTDCCQDRAIPLRVEISEDAKVYKTITERKAPFLESFTTDFPKTKARYIKLTDLQNTAFHLNEVEVY